MILHAEGRWQQRLTLVDAGEAVFLRSVEVKKKKSVEVRTLDLMEFTCAKCSAVLFHIHANTFLNGFCYGPSCWVLNHFVHFLFTI